MYESPIQMIVDKIQTQMIQQEEDQLLMQVQKSLRFDIDKAELLRALNYDRDQYQKGYKDGLNQYNQDASIDCISREDAIEEATKEGSYGYISAYELSNLPSVTPKDDRQEVIDRICKLQTYKLFQGGEKMVELDKVIAILEGRTDD